MAIQPFQEQSPYEDDRPEIKALDRVTSMPHAAKRSRFGTHRPKKEEGIIKRRSILRRFQRPGSSASKSSGDGTDAYAEPSKSQPEKPQSQEALGEGRTIYFNRRLPDSARDEEGRPKQQFARNKIRTAKYTALSFVPKNLWFQFHNIANVYFLFIIILSVCCLSSDDSFRCSNMISDLLNLWSFESWLERRAPHYHSHPYSHQRCHRGYPKDCTRQ